MVRRKAQNGPGFVQNANENRELFCSVCFYLMIEKERAFLYCFVEVTDTADI